MASPSKSVRRSRCCSRPRSVCPSRRRTARSVRWCLWARPAPRRSCRRTRRRHWSCAVRTSIITTRLGSRRPSTGACSGTLCTRGWWRCRWLRCWVPRLCTRCVRSCCKKEEEKRPRGRKDIPKEFLQIELLVRFFFKSGLFSGSGFRSAWDVESFVFFFTVGIQSLWKMKTHTHPHTLKHIRFCIMMLGKRLFRFPYRNANAIAFRFYSVYLKWSRFEYICCWSQSLCTHKTYNPHSHTHTQNSFSLL